MSCDKLKIAETIDLDDHDRVVAFLRAQSDKIKKLEKREQQLLDEIEDFQELLAKNDDVCHDHVITIIDDKIAAIPEVYIVGGRYKTKELIEKAYKDGYLRGLKDLRKELEE